MQSSALHPQMYLAPCVDEDSESAANLAPAHPCCHDLYASHVACAAASVPCVKVFV